MKYLNKTKKLVIDNKRLICIFVFSILAYEFFSVGIHFQDPKAMYTFSHAIKMGEVPYRDFNIISTPLYAFIMVPGLFIFDNYLTFIIEQSILVTILFWFLFKLLDKKAWIVLFAMVFTAFLGMNLTYNFLCFINIIILWYLEKKQPNKDILIGVVIGLAILSKHTVGLFLIVPMFIICFKDIKKLGKRVLGICIPCIIFLLYLVINHALYDFINLSFLGMFDFGTSNSVLKGNLFIIALILIVIMFMLVIKHFNDKPNYYLLCGILFIYPICDLNHFALLFNCFAILVLSYLNIKEIDYFSKLSIIFTLLYSVGFVTIVSISSPIVFYKGFNHYQYTLGYKYDYQRNKTANKIIDSYYEKADKEKKDIIFISVYSMFYDLINDNKITYYDVLLYGNHGYKGTERMIKEIDNMKDSYIIVDMSGFRALPGSQLNKKIFKHVVNNYEMIDEKDVLRLYYKP